MFNARYELFAVIFFNKLRANRFDSKLWHYELNFKKSANIADALFIARRHLDHAFAIKNRCLIILAFGCDNAFDSIMLEPMFQASIMLELMFQALHRFGFLDAFIH